MSDLHFTAQLEGLPSGDIIETTETADEGIMKTTDVGAILHLLLEDVTGIVFAVNMENFYEVILNPFMDSIVPKFHVAHVLHSDSVGPLHSIFVIIVDKGSLQIFIKGSISNHCQHDTHSTSRACGMK